MINPIRVSICDSSPALRYGLKFILDSDPGIETVIQASSQQEMVKNHVAEDFDILLIDLEENESYGFDYLRKFHSLRPDVKIIVFSSCTNKQLIMEALNLGIHGFQVKQADSSQILHTIYRVHSGGTSMADCVTTALIENMSVKPAQPKSKLSTREEQVLELIATGRTNDDIADKLYISVRTVKYHVTSIFNKLRVKNRTQAAAMWML